MNGRHSDICEIVYTTIQNLPTTAPLDGEEAGSWTEWPVVPSPRAKVTLLSVLPEAWP